jgi:acyl carrier protein
MKDKVFAMIKEALASVNEELADQRLHVVTMATRLYGGNSALDSLALVNLIADLEDLISEEFGQEVVLADEKAMSQQTSPFRTVESLTDYITTLLGK